MNTEPKRNIMIVLQGQLKDAGVTLVPNATQFIVHLEKEMSPAKPNELILGHQQGGGLLRSAKNTLGAESNFFQGHKKPEGFIDLLTAALQSQGMNKSVELLYKMDRLAYEDAMFLPLWREYSIIAQHPYVKGVVWYWGKTHFTSFKEAWLDK